MVYTGHYYSHFPRSTSQPGVIPLTITSAVVVAALCSVILRVALQAFGTECSSMRAAADF